MMGMVSNIITECRALMKQADLIKMYSNYTYNKVHTGIHLPDTFPIHHDLKQRVFFIITVFQLYIIYHLEGRDGTQTEQNTSASGLC
jgi:hypothetical protein